MAESGWKVSKKASKFTNRPVFAFLWKLATFHMFGTTCITRITLQMSSNLAAFQNH